MEYQHNPAPQTQQPQQEVGNKPDLVIRDGNLKASIWRNENERGTYYTSTIAKTYTDQNGKPRDTNTLNQTDLLRASELGRKAYGAINELKRSQTQQQTQQHNHTQSF